MPKSILLAGFGLILWSLSFGQTSQIDSSILLKVADSLRDQSNYDSALVQYQRIIEISVSLDDQKNHIKALNGLGLSYIDLSKYEQAASYLLEAIDLGTKYLKTNDPILGESYARLGYCYSQSQQIAKAIENYEMSISIFLSSLGVNSSQTAKAYSRLGAAYYLLGNSSDKAIDLMLQSISIYEKHGNALDIARVYNDLANVYQDELNFEVAIDYHKQSLEIKNSNLKPLHPEIGVSNYNLGRVYYSMGDYDKSIEYYRKTLEVDLETFGENHRWVGEDYYSIADCYTAYGNYELALKFAQKSADILLGAYGSNSPRYATSLMTVGQAHLNLGDASYSIEFFKKALTIFSRHKNENRDITSGLAQAHALIGVAMSKEGLNADAIEHLNISINSGISTMVDYTNFIAESHRNIGYCYAEIGDLDNALKSHNRALAVLTRDFGQHHPKIAESYQAIGDVYLKNDDISTALAQYQTALISLVPSLDSDYNFNPTLKQLSMLPATLDILNQKAWTLNIKYEQDNNPDDLNFSMATFQLAMDLIDTLRIGFLEQGSKQSLLENHLEIYERSLSVTNKLYSIDSNEAHLATAFKIMEKSKSFMLLTSLRESSAQKFARLPTDILEQEHQLKASLAFHQSQAQTESNSEKKIDHRNKAFNLGKSYDSLMLVLSQDYPQYHQLKYNTSVATLKEVQESLTSDEVIIQYFLGSSALFTLASDADQHLMLSQPITPEFLENIELLRKCMTGKLNFSQQYAKASHQLYESLIGPVANLTMGKTVTIVPDGVLNYFPFEILTSEYTGKEKSYIDLPYLIYQTRVNYAFSATLLLATKADQIPEKEINYLAFAPNFNERPDTAQTTGYLALQEVVRGNLSELRGTKREAKSISQYFKGVFLQDAAATESEFKQRGPNYDIIHLATHAIVDDSNPMNSRLLFTASEDSNEDGDLFVWELYNMELTAQMAVLSACNTGFGKLERGEGVMSLGRAFAYAGCPSIIMSLWPAQDDATADIMELFYKGIADGLSKDHALSQAKTLYLESANDLFAHPFYWAGFVSQGDPRPLEIKPSIPYWSLFVLMIAVLLICWLLLKKSQKQVVGRN